MTSWPQIERDSIACACSILTFRFRFSFLAGKDQEISILWLVLPPLITPPKLKAQSSKLKALAFFFFLFFFFFFCYFSNLPRFLLLAASILLCQLDGVADAHVAAGFLGALGADQLRRADWRRKAVRPRRVCRHRLLLRPLPRRPKRSRLFDFSWLLVDRVLLNFAPFWRWIIDCSSGGRPCGGGSVDSGERWGDTGDVTGSCWLDRLLYCEVFWKKERGSFGYWLGLQQLRILMAFSNH